MARPIMEIISHIRAVCANQSVVSTLIQTEDLDVLCDAAERNYIEMYSEISPVNRDAVEDAFRGWLARNDHALTLGGTGDLVDLVFVLKAALATTPA